MRLIVFLAATLVPLTAFAEPSDFGARLSAAAIERTNVEVVYDPSYRRIGYPMGDVAANRGVCADEVVRALRAINIDLQVLVHQDMEKNFSAYPQFWGLSAPDSNIDHRRAPNLETYMTRKGWRLAPSLDAKSYRPGDIVAWNLRGDAGFLPHIGIVTDRIGASGWPMVVHNIGAGPKLEDVLFSWPMTGRYRPQAPDSATL
jgi:uncharacterized protein YijF (DUF1287 family)